MYDRKVFQVLGQAPSTAGGRRKHVQIKVTYFYRKNVKIPLASISPNDDAKSLNPEDKIASLATKSKVCVLNS